MKLVALVQDPKSAARFLRHLGEPNEPPARAPAGAPPITRPPSSGDSRSATTPPEHAAKGRVASARRQSAIQAECGARGARRETPTRFREGFRARPRLYKPRSFRLRSPHFDTLRLNR